MGIAEMLDELKQKALKDDKLRQELLDTRDDSNPLTAFCRKCQSLGYAIYELYAAMKRSTNGGGENSPMLEGEDDFYELFFAGLEI